MTMDEYNKLKAQQMKDEKLFGKFEALRSRAYQTSEFDKLVSSSGLFLWSFRPHPYLWCTGRFERLWQAFRALSWLGEHGP
jgi:hypothetical protein